MRRDTAPQSGCRLSCWPEWVGLEELHLLECAVDDGRRITAEPVIQDGGIERPEVSPELQIAACFLLTWLQRWIFAVKATLDLLTHGEGYAGRAVVGARTVVRDAPAELGEHQ